jgi:6-phosphogluconolactonase (cycloisomerase 2 family)
MRNPVRLLGVAVVVTAAAMAAVVPAQADESGGAGPGHVVFVQTNSTDGNGIAAYHRNSDGTLSYLTTYSTRGLGGRESGAGTDPLASQGSLVLVRDAGLLLAVNAGSNTISVFTVEGDQLQLIQVLDSGGSFPTGFAVRGDLVYVQDGGGQGAVSGYRIAGRKLHPIENSTRTLDLGNTPNPFFLASTAEVGFTPDGAHLIVTTKTHGTVDVFSVTPDGRLSSTPVKNVTAGPVPFAFVFDSSGRLILNFAGNSSLEAFTVNADNTITPVTAAVSDTQAALCWVTSAAGFDYTTNTGSGDLSQYSIPSGGTPVLINPIAAGGIPGATDSAAADGSFLYVQSGTSSTIHVFAIGAGGSLTRIQVASVPDGDDQEGIAVG